MVSTDLLMNDKITPIEYDGFRFLIMDCPTNDNIKLYLKPLKNHNCKHLVRVCEPTYACGPLNNEGITVHEMPFPDGQSPPSSVLNSWLDLVEDVYKTNKATGEIAAIAVHCVAGLGRAPVLVATALVEHGVKPLDAVELIRKKRKGAFNNKQISFLDAYKKRNKTLSISKSFARVFRRSNSTVNADTLGSASSSTTSVNQGAH